jgi:hypothetical protein
MDRARRRSRPPNQKIFGRKVEPFPKRPHGVATGPDSQTGHG